MYNIRLTYLVSSLSLENTPVCSWIILIIIIVICFLGILFEHENLTNNDNSSDNHDN